MKSIDVLERARQLQARGDVDHAEASLLDAIELAEREDDIVTLTRARLALAELLHEQGRTDEADPYFVQVIRTERADGSVHPEVRRAAAILKEIRGWS